MSNLINILISEQLLAYWVLVLVVLIEKFVYLPEKYHPLTLLKLMAQGMANKVVTSEPRQIRQQQIAGILAPLTLLLPVCTVIAVFILLSQFPLFFESIMLLTALKFQYVIKQTQKVNQALRSEKKILARQMLSPIVLRETEKLSPMGIVKANIESVLLRFCYQYCSVIFWYLIAGGVGALVYRVLYELSHSWNVKLIRFRYFGGPTRRLIKLLQLVPSCLTCCSLILACNLKLGAAALIQGKSYKSLSMFILNISASAMGISLGGPAYYNNKKIRMPSCGLPKQVTLADNQRVLIIVNSATWVTMIAALLFYFLTYSTAQIH
ncbi:MAG: cobalamin biosynthesis protein [Paraglaciecola sp.]|uniref:cobalamin biosynthesis protein CobD/CbiB n=1 Tax=Paraglaciecola sp. TaxID=1920173 RepID=UPI00329948D3